MGLKQFSQSSLQGPQTVFTPSQTPANQEYRELGTFVLEARWVQKCGPSGGLYKGGGQHTSHCTHSSAGGRRDLQPLTRQGVLPAGGPGAEAGGRNCSSTRVGGQNDSRAPGGVEAAQPACHPPACPGLPAAWSSLGAGSCAHTARGGSRGSPRHPALNTTVLSNGQESGTASHTSACEQRSNLTNTSPYKTPRPFVLKMPWKFWWTLTEHKFLSSHCLWGKSWVITQPKHTKTKWCPRPQPGGQFKEAQTCTNTNHPVWPWLTS